MQEDPVGLLLPRPTTYMFSGRNNMSRTVGSRDRSGDGSSPGHSAEALAESEDGTPLPPLRPTLSPSPSSASSCPVDDDCCPLSPGDNQATLLASTTRRKRSRSWSTSSSPISTCSKTANNNRPCRRPAIGTATSGDCYRGCGGPIRGEGGGGGPARGYKGQDLQRLGEGQVGDGGCSKVVTEETSLDARRREEGSGGSSGSDTLPPGAAVEANGSGAGSSSSSPDKEKEGTAPANKSAGRVLVSDGQRAHRQRTGGARGKEEGGGTARGETIKGRGRCAEGGVDGEEEGVEARRCARQQHEAVRVVVHEVLSEDFGLFTWPSGVVLACLVWARRREFDGASVVEIGAGTALPGLLAAKLGASVVLTDREEAPWVLENMRGVVAANGLNGEPPDDTGPAAETAGADTAVSAAAAIAGGGSGPGTAAAGVAAGAVIKEWQNSEKDERREGWEPDGRGTAGDSSLAPSAGAGAGAESFPRAQEKGATREAHIGGVTRLGRCSVQGLSWGRVGAAAIKLARERRPEVVLGADVFYSSEHFNDVLATAFMLLSGSSSMTPAAGGGGCASGEVDDTTTAPLARTTGTSSAVADAPLSSMTYAGGGGDCANSDVDGRTTAPPANNAAGTSSAAAPTASETTPRGRDTAGGGAATLAGTVGSERQRTSSPGPADTTPTFGSPFSRSRGVFLTAYQERSARRSIRPLLRKWGMQARVLRDVPRRVLPPALWESGRYDSVALLEITLT